MFILIATVLFAIANLAVVWVLVDMGRSTLHSDTPVVVVTDDTPMVELSVAEIEERYLDAWFASTIE